MKKSFYGIIFLFVLILIAGVLVVKYMIVSPFGEKIDSYNGVDVFSNGFLSGNHIRNKAPDGYNIGIKYQCVEYVKRYYFQYLNHKMPDSYGHAKSFFDKSINDGQKNLKRDLVQFRNNSFSKPMINDIVVWDGYLLNPYGHVAIIVNVNDSSIEVIQQNPGIFSSTRNKLSLITKDNKYTLKPDRILGWLRKDVQCGT